MFFKKFLYSSLFIFLFTTTCYASAINLSSQFTILVDADSGCVLDEKNSNDKIFPASTTKILTAILAIENLDLDKAIVVTNTGIDIPWDSSKVDLISEEVISVENLLYCTLLSSGNDAANMLGEAVSGSIDNFVILMNEKAKSLGCKNTNFVNAHGYHNKNHYTTASDMAIILRYALQSEKFRKICATATYIVPATNKSAKRNLTNTNRLLLTKEQNKYACPYKYALGGKTGYTTEAGRCFVGWAKKDDKTLIACVFNAPVEGTQDPKFIDSINLFEYGFNNFEKKQVISKQDYILKFKDEQNNYEYILELKDNLSMLIKNSTKITEIGYSIINNTIDFNKLLNGSQQDIDITFNIVNNDYESTNVTSKLSVITKEKIIKFDIDSFLSNLLYICIILLVTNIILSIILKSKKGKYIKASSVDVSRKNRRRNF